MTENVTTSYAVRVYDPRTPDQFKWLYCTRICSLYGDFKGPFYEKLESWQKVNWMIGPRPTLFHTAGKAKLRLRTKVVQDYREDGRRFDVVEIRTVVTHTVVATTAEDAVTKLGMLVA